MESKYKLGSLFDGSGGFPLAGSLCGIEPVWAAEVESYPIAVTRSRFPNMKHLGDISKVNGEEIEPVDIITFGSPCQDLSVAGKRAGLKHEANGDEETTRSGLFMEAVRIIKEMRSATNGEYPTFALWENVPGAFSSNKGEDFRIVCEELIKIVEPSASMPDVPKNGWPYADSYCGDGWSLAYRVFDAQYWGVPQRRRRIHLVLNLRGERAREVLFEREGVRGYFTQGRTPRQAAAPDAERSAGADDRAGERARELDAIGECTPINLMIATRHKQLGRGTGFGVGEAGDPQFTISAAHEHAVCYAVDRADAADPNPSKSQGGIAIVEPVPYTLKIRSGCEGGGKGALVQKDKSATLATNNDQYLFQPIAFAQNQRDEVRDLNDVAGALAAEPGMKQQTFVAVPNLLLDKQDGKGNGLGVGEAGDPMNTLTSGDCHAVAYGVGNEQANQSFSKEQIGALNCMHDQQAVAYQTQTIRYIVRRLTPTECARLQGFADRWGDIDEKDGFTPEEHEFWQEVRNTHAAINGRKVQEYTEQQMLTWYNKLHTDSAEYKMWGNGIALPPALYCMQGIADALENAYAE